MTKKYYKGNLSGECLFRKVMCEYFCKHKLPCKECPMNWKPYYNHPIKDMLSISKGN